MTFAQPFSAYEVIERLGAGSMGTVFKARDKKLGRIVALKVLKPSLARNEKYVERLRREARIVASLNHPNIVAGFDLGHEGGYHFFVMECVEGSSLRELLESWGQFDEERVLEVAIQITAALDHAFKRGVIHRDIKPANVLIDADNTVKLTDMGLAKGPENLELTRQGAMVGTPQYVSPEQAQSPQDVDVRSDLYSLGATLFHMATGQPPFRAASMGAVLQKVLHERAPSAAGVNPELSDGLSLVIRKLLNKDPARRYQTPAELLEDLQRLQRAEPPLVDEADLDQDAVTPGRERLWWFGLAGVVLLVAGLWAAISLFGHGQPPAQPGESAVQRFREQLYRELDGLGTVGARLERLRAEAATAQTAAERAQVAKLRKVEEEKLLLGALPRFLDGQRSGLEALVSQLPWRDPEAAHARRLRAALQDELGLGVEQLPAAARQRYKTGEERLGAALRPLLADRANRYRRRLANHFKGVTQDWREALYGGDLPAARQAVRRGLEQVDELGRELAPGPLDDALAAARAQAQNQAEKQAEREIRAREGDLLRAFEAELAAILDAAEVLARTDPRRARARLDAAQGDLRADYPEARFERSPWPAALARLRSLRGELSTRQLTQDEAQLRRALRLTMKAMLAGEPGQFGYYAAGLPETLAAPARALFAAADEARTLLLTRLLDGRANRKLKTHGGRGRDDLDLEIEIRRGSGSGPELLERGKPVSLGLVSVVDLCDRLGGTSFCQGLEPRLRAGLACWMLLSDGPQTPIRQLLGQGAAGGLFREHLFGLAEELEIPADDWARFQDLLLRTRQSVLENGDYATGQKHLNELRRRFASFAKDHERELAKLQVAIATGLARARAERAMVKRRLDGVEVAVDAALDARVVYPMRRVGIELPGGWMLARDAGVALRQPADDLSRALRHRLSVETLLAAEQKEFVAEMEFEVEPEAEAPRFWILRCHGAGVGLGLLRDGRVGLVPLPPQVGNQLRRDCHKALQRSLEARGDRIRPRVRHRLRLHIRHKGGRRATITLSLDPDSPKRPGQDLGQVEVQRDKDAPQRFELAGMAPILVRELRFAGRAPTAN